MSDSKPGLPSNPYTHAPPEFFTPEGLPYGAFCRCSGCGRVARSTFLFDFYAVKHLGPLMCETCEWGRPYASVKPVMDALKASGDFADYPEDS